MSALLDFGADKLRQVSHGTKKLTLLGKEIKYLSQAPNTTLIDKDLSEINLESLLDRLTLISVVPSVDTSTCNLQTKRFNKEIEQFTGKANFITVSLDLPFAQSRYKDTSSCSNSIMLSDYKYHSFAKEWGVYLKELGLLTRAVFLVNKSKTIVYVEYVENISNEPNYTNVLSAISANILEVEPMLKAV